HVFRNNSPGTIQAAADRVQKAGRCRDPARARGAGEMRVVASPGKGSAPVVRVALRIGSGWAPRPGWEEGLHVVSPGAARPRFYAVTPGDRIEDAWSLADFPDGAYHICMHGPNGFFREF